MQTPESTGMSTAQLPTAQPILDARPPDPDPAAPARVEPWQISEQLLLTGLHAQDVADQLRHQLALTTAITHSLAEGVYAVDDAARVTFVNPALERMLGWQRAEMLDQDAATVVPLHAADTGAPAAPPSLQAVLHGGIPYQTDQAMCTRKDGTHFPAAYTAAPIVTDGQVVGAVVTLRDRTAVEQLERARDEYLALLGHDLRQPLTVLLGHAHLLRRWVAQPDLAHEGRRGESVEAIMQSGLQMTQMIADLLDRSLLEAGRADLHLGLVNLVDVVTRSIDQTTTPTERARIQVDAATPILVVVDAARMVRVVGNLLTNACKYSAPAGPVRVRVARADGQAVIAVTDQGVGIDADDLPQVFAKHYRARTAGTTPGTGLGLYSSRLIVDAHGGRLWAHSTVGVGSTFGVSLPISDPSWAGPAA